MPITISESFNWTYQYLIKKVNNDYHIIAEYYIGISDTANLDKGEYYIALQNPHWESEYNISISCPPPTQNPTEAPSASPTLLPSKSPTTPLTKPTAFPTTFPSQSPTTAPTGPKLDETMMKGLVFGSMGTLLVGFIMFYIYKWTKYRQQKTSNSQPTSPKRSEYKSVASLEQEEEKETTITLKSDTVDEHKTEPDIEDPEGLSASVVDNVLQNVLKYAIQCCQNTQEFDIYQV